MSGTTKLRTGAVMPTLSVPKVGGGEIATGGNGRWQMVVVYRSKHYPICMRYLKNLDGLLDEFRAIGAEVIAICGDPQEKAENEAADENWRFPVAYGMTIEQMRTLGLYISTPRSPQETDRRFPEPGLFVVNPQGQAQVIDISNAPFARPELQGVLNGLKFVQEKNYLICLMA